jgi:hypothetical protein
LLLSNEQKQFYLDNGYLVVKRHVPKAAYREAQAAALRLVEKCARGAYPYCRADKRLDDRFVEKIEHIFHPDLFEPAIFKAVVESRILDYAKEALGYSDVFCSFYRMHPTIGYSTWSSWHRDDNPDGRDWTIKATLPLFPECGFAVVPGSHVDGDRTLDEWKPVKGESSAVDTSYKGHIPNQVIVPVEAGDILLFHTAIAHRGACAGRSEYKRAQVYLRVTATKYARQTPRVRQDFQMARSELLEIADRSWTEELTKQVDDAEFYPATERGAPTPPLRKLKQLVARAFYYGSALLPPSHQWVTDPPDGYLPYVRVGPAYQSMFD